METFLNLTYRIFNHNRTPQQDTQHRRQTLREQKHSEEKTRVLSQRPPPLPQNRRNLTDAPLSSHPQPTSPLFTILPPEIRQRIYNYVIGDRVIQLVHIDKRILHRSLELPDLQNTEDNEDATGDLPLHSTPTISWLDEPKLIPHPNQFTTLPLSLLQTCHAIYTETLPILYTTNTFIMTSPLPLLYLHDYTLLPQRLSQIRHLQLIDWMYFDNPVLYNGRVHEPYDEETWPRFWDVVAGMGLKSLGLRVQYCGKREEECDIGAGWIRPLLGVRGLERVGLRIEYRAGAWDTRRLNGLEEEIEKVWRSKGCGSFNIDT